MKKILLSIFLVLLVVIGVLAYLQLPPFSHGPSANAMVVSNSLSKGSQLVAHTGPAPTHNTNFRATANTQFQRTPAQSATIGATTSKAALNTIRNVPNNSFAPLPPIVQQTTRLPVAHPPVVSIPPNRVPQSGVVVKTSFNPPNNTRRFAHANNGATAPKVQQGTFATSNRPFNTTVGNANQLNNARQSNFGQSIIAGPVRPISQQPVNTRKTRAFGSPPSQFPTIATNLQTLVRAQYKLPIDAAKKLEELFAFEGNEKVETTTLNLKHPKLILLQVTTDSATQKAIALFLDTIYSTKRIEEIEASTTLPEASEEDTTATDAEKVSLKLPGMT